MKALREERPMPWFGDPMLCYACSIAELDDKTRKITVKIRIYVIFLTVTVCALVWYIFSLLL